MTYGPLQMLRDRLPPDARDRLDSFADAIIKGAGRGSPPDVWRAWLRRTMPMLTPKQAEAILAYAAARAGAAGHQELLEASMALQASLRKQQAMIGLLTKIANMRHEMLKSVAQNLRG